jgi:hypothetical protein
MSGKTEKILLAVGLCLLITGFKTAPYCYSQDSLDIHYSIVGMKFYSDHDVIKIKVPPWLKSSEVMFQIKKAIQWPGEPPPRKKTYIYVFKETAQVGEASQTGAVYIPGKGFIWSLSDWKPIEPPDRRPSENDLNIYYTFIDRIIQNGSSLDNTRIRREVAQEFHLSVAELDSIYSWVKYWLGKKQEEQAGEKQSFLK